MVTCSSRDAVAGRVAVGQGCEIDERFERGPGLPAALLHVVVLKKAVIQPTHPGLDVARVGVHRHHARLQKVLVIRQRIQRGHHQRGVVVVVLPGKHLHRPLGVQGRIEQGRVALVAGGQRLIRLGAPHLGGNEIGQFFAFFVYPGVAVAVAPRSCRSCAARPASARAGQLRRVPASANQW